MSDTHGWTRHGTREIYTNPWIAVREDAVTRPDGSDGIYGVVTMRNPAVFVVALDDDGAVLLVSLYRYATRGMSLEVPAGGCDGEEPLLAAQREWLEETGFVAREWREIGRVNALNGICDAPEFVYLATGLERSDSAGASGAADDATGVVKVEEDLDARGAGGACSGVRDGGVDVAAEQRAEGIDMVRFVPWGEAMNLVRNGTISDGESVAALMFATLELGRL